MISFARLGLPVVLGGVLVACGGGGAPPPPSGLSYPTPQAYVIGTAIAPLNPSVTGNVTSWSVSPALPAGLTIDARSGAISGTPTTPTARADYTIAARNAGGSATFNLSIGVNAPGLAVCHAISPASWVACASTASSGSLDEISIDAPISCTGANACAALIYKLTRALAILGNGQTIQRLDSSDYPVLVISNSSHVTVSNLLIEDAPNVADYTKPSAALTATNTACHSTAGWEDCAPTLFIAQSDHVTLDHLTVEHAKREAVTLDSGSDLQVMNCTFRDAFLSGLSTGRGTTRVTIADSLFEDIRSNAVVISGSQIAVSGNTFHHDHHAAGWWYGSEPHPSSGGVIDVYNYLHDFVFEGNEIYGSQIDEQIDPSLAGTEFGLQATGVEIDYAADDGQTTDMTNVQILGNRIHDMSGVAISLSLEYLHDPSVGITISGNTFYNDFTDPTTGAPITAARRSATYAGPVTYPFDQNCFAQICPSPQPPVPSPPAPPLVLSSAPACTDGYGGAVTGSFGEAVSVDVYDSVSGTILHSYIGLGGPYNIDHRTVTLNADGTRTVLFCYATAAERAAFDGTGVNVYLGDPFSFLNSGPVGFRRM